MQLHKSRLAVCLLLAGSILTGSTPAARASDAKSIVKLVPKDAWGFVIVRSLSNTNEKATSLATTLGLPMMGSLEDMLNAVLPLGDTLDNGSPIGVIALDYNKYADEGVIFVVPSKDPKALIEKLQGGEPTDGIFECSVVGETMYAAVKDTLVLLSPNKDCVGLVAKNATSIAADVDDARFAVMDKSDVYVSISAAAIVTAFKDQIQMVVQMIGGAMGGQMKALDPLLKMMNETRAFDMALTIDKAGVGVSFLIAAKKDSDFEKFIGETKNTSAPLLAWLPKENYLLVIGGTGEQGKYAEKFGAGNTGAMLDGLKSSIPMGMDEAALSGIIENLATLLETTGRTALCISALSGEGEGLFGLSGAFELKNAGAFVKGIRDLYAKVWELSDDEDFEALKQVFVHKADAETVDGRQLDTLTIDLKAIGDDLGDEELEMAAKLLGKEIVLRFGAIDDTHVIFSFGGGQDRYKKLAGAVKTGSGGLSDDAGIKSVSSNLPSPRSTETFIAVDAILQIVKRIAPLIGEPDAIPFEVPTINSPLAFSGCLQGKVGRADVFIPMKLIEAGKAAYEQVMTTGMNDFDADEDEELDAGADSDTDDGDDGDDG